MAIAIGAQVQVLSTRDTQPVSVRRSQNTAELAKTKDYWPESRPAPDTLFVFAQFSLAFVTFLCYYDVISVTINWRGRLT